MAKRNSTRGRQIAPGITLTENRSGLHYHGTPQALIAAGLIDKSMLPGAPGQTKSYARGRRDGKHISVRNCYNGKLTVTEYSEGVSDDSSAIAPLREWKHYAYGVEVRSAETADDDRCYRGWPQYLLDAGVIGEDLLQGGYAIYGDKRVNAEVHDKGWLLVHERLVDFERLPELSVAENEMIVMFRHCCHVGQIHLIQLARSFAELNKNIGDGNVIDFAAYRRERGHAEAR